MKIKAIILFVLLSGPVFGQKVQKNFWKDPFPRKPAGVWEFYDFKGELEQTYDFTKDSLIYQKTFPQASNVKYRAITGSDTLLTKLDTPPILIGGSAVVMRTLTNNLKYPPEARERRIQRRVIISFMVASDGKASDFKIQTGIGSACDEEALRVIKLIHNKWYPGILNGKRVSTIYTIPVFFRLG